MSFQHYVVMFAVISAVTAQLVEVRSPNLARSTTATRTVQIPDYITRGQIPDYIARGQSPAIIAYTLQLPRTDAPGVPFYPPELIPDLQPPKVQNQNVPIFYDYPEPSVLLQVPKEDSWNPSNDPNLYYDSAPLILDLETPTNLHPKKFDKNLHEKKYSGEPKKEVILKPVTSDELAQLQKTAEKVAKVENQKSVRSEKAEQTVQI